MKLSRRNSQLSPAMNFFRSLPVSTECSLADRRWVCGHFLMITGMRLPSGEYLMRAGRCRGTIANSGKICSHPGPFPAGKRTLLGQLDDTLTSCSNVGNRKVGSDSVRAMQTADIFCSESLGERGVPSQQPTNLYVLIKHAPMFSPASPCSCRRRPIVRQWAPCCSHTHNSCPSPGLPPVRGCP
jgi:hypothetical protein